VAQTTPESGNRGKVFLPKDFEERRDRAIAKALEGYWEDMQLGVTATMVRLAFKAGFIAGQEFEEGEKWRKMMAGIGRDG
jgi:hypothetical protein